MPGFLDCSIIKQSKGDHSSWYARRTIIRPVELLCSAIFSKFITHTHILATAVLERHVHSHAKTCLIRCEVVDCFILLFSAFCCSCGSVHLRQRGMYHWWSLCLFTRIPGESYRRRLRSLLLYSCYVFRALIISLVC